MLRLSEPGSVETKPPFLLGVRLSDPLVALAISRSGSFGLIPGKHPIFTIFEILELGGVIFKGKFQGTSLGKRFST